MAQNTNQFHDLCITISTGGDDDIAWEDIRDWLNSEQTDDARRAIEEEDEEFGTALHIICRKRPPIDIVASFLDLAPNVIFCRDKRNGYLPLHVAVAHKASENILTLLIERYPGSIREVDSRERTPLHIAIVSRRIDLTEPVVTLLLKSSQPSTRSQTIVHNYESDNADDDQNNNDDSSFDWDESTATCIDKSGKTPLHYACAYGTSKEAFDTLIKAYPECVDWHDANGFTPFHYALSNCEPYAAKHLISLRPDIINEPVAENNFNHPAAPRNNGSYIPVNTATNRTILNKEQVPLNILGCRASELDTNSCDDKTKNLIERAKECLLVYINAKPQATPSFITALQLLPPWLYDIAVVHPFVQDVINQRMSERFHFAICFFDALLLGTAITAFTIAVFDIIGAGDMYYTYTPEGERWILNPDIPFKVTGILPVLLLVTGTYFLTRELIQLSSALSVGLIRSFLNTNNFLSLLSASLNFYWAWFFNKGTVTEDRLFRASAVLSLFVYTSWLVAFLSSVSAGFAVFLSGFKFVVRRLVAFLMALVTILTAFALIFYFLFKGTDTCPVLEGTNKSSTTSTFYFCNYGDSFVSTLTMLIGEVSDTDFYSSRTSIFFFTLFVFLVVILLANVLIAIVTDSYGVIRDERASIVFWSQRLDFIAEIDMITNGPWRHRTVSFSGFEIYDNLFSDLWEDLMGEVAVRHWSLYIMRFLFLVLFVIPLGLFSAGILWPPQVREFLMYKTSTNFRNKGEQDVEIDALRDDMQRLQDKFDTLSSKRQDKAKVLKNQLENSKETIEAEVNEIKEIMTELLNLHLARQGS